MVMRKLWVIAVREYLAAVRTKTFIVSMVVMPLLMGGSVLVQTLFKDVDVSEKRYVFIDRASRGKATTKDGDGASSASLGKTLSKIAVPPFVLESRKAREDAAQQRYELSEDVRKGKLAGFFELLDGEAQPVPPAGGMKGLL